MPVWLISAFGFLKDYWKPLLIAGLIAGLFVQHSCAKSSIDKLKSDKAVVEQQRDQALSANADLKADFDRAKNQWQDSENIAKSERDEAAKRAAKYKELLDALNASPPGDDGPIAPVLRRAIDGLYP